MGRYVVLKRLQPTPVKAGVAETVAYYSGRGVLKYAIFTGTSSHLALQLVIDDDVETFPSIEDLYSLNATSMNNRLWVPVYSAGEYCCEFLMETEFEENVEVRVKNAGGSDCTLTNALVIVWMEGGG